MNRIGKSGLLNFFRNHSVAQIFFYLNLLNLLNLSVNFYEGNISNSSEQLVDPIDTLGELVYEWALDGDCDVIPDNSTQQEDKSLENIDWEIIYMDFPIYSFEIYEKTKVGSFHEPLFLAPLHLPPSPPPDLG